MALKFQSAVTLPIPDSAERARIWEVLTPPEAPLSHDVDFSALGENYELAGGHIKNAILRAAYKAREQGTVIRQAYLAGAAVAECQAQGKLIREDEPDLD